MIVLKKIVRKTAVFICVALCFAGTLYLSAETHPEFTVTVPEGFVSAFENTEKDEIAKITGMTADAVENYFSENKLIFFAADTKNSTQIKISCDIDDFSERIVNFAYLEDEKLTELSDELFSDGKAEIITSGGLKFLKKAEMSSDSGGEYVAVRYITAVNGKNYRISVLSSGNTEPEIADEFLKSFKVPTVTDKTENTWLNVLIIAGIAIFAAVAVITAITLIKSKKESPEI